MAPPYLNQPTPSPYAMQSTLQLRNLLLLFFFLFFYLNHIFIVKVQELACTVRYGINKTLIPKTSNKRNHRLQSPKRWPQGRAPLTVTTHERKETHEILGVPSRHDKV